LMAPAPRQRGAKEHDGIKELVQIVEVEQIGGRDAGD
jgi:hypothetical protein